MQCQKCQCELNEENTCCDGGTHCKTCKPECKEESCHDEGCHCGE